MMRGYTLARIGEELYVADSTMKTHSRHIYRKVGVGGTATSFRSSLRRTERNEVIASVSSRERVGRSILWRVLTEIRLSAGSVRWRLQCRFLFLQVREEG